MNAPLRLCLIAATTLISASIPNLASADIGTAHGALRDAEADSHRVRICRRAVRSRISNVRRKLSRRSRAVSVSRLESILRQAREYCSADVQQSLVLAIDALSGSIPVKFRVGRWASLSIAEAACARGKGEACFELALLYSAGRGFTRSLKDSIRMHRKACKDGWLPSCVELGLAHYKGKGLAKKPKKAMNLFAKACDGGNGKGCWHLADMYDRGVGVMQNQVEAGQLRQKACKNGFKRACHGKKLPKKKKPGFEDPANANNFETEISL